MKGAENAHAKMRNAGVRKGEDAGKMTGLMARRT